ncbi:MAG TPA: DNA starvation/stationary phase protection protein [Puia sp.]|nr:DNA starvation/stationary phase protection protein [Puia sp.]
MNPNIGITENNRQSIAMELLELLADEYLLYTKTRNAHWNIEGGDFHSMHVFFELQYRELSEVIDKVAERIRALGSYAPASLSSFLNMTGLTESPMERNDSSALVKELLEDHEYIIMSQRKSINRFTDLYLDSGTGDFISGLVEKHEEMAWKLRAQLQ